MKKKLPDLVLIILLFGIISGCQRDLSKPESKPKIVPVERTNIKQSEVLPVYSQKSREIPSLFVHYETKESNVFIECIVTGISFRESDQSMKKVGKIVVWIDGKKSSEVSSAAFIVKGLSPGDHNIKLEVVQLNNQSYGLAKELLVNIPK